MRKDFLPFSPPFIGEEEIAEVTDSLRSGWITTPMTFTATVAVIEHVGAKPVLVDIKTDTMNIDPALVAKAVTDRTKAVIAVHYGGHPCDLDTLQAICNDHDLLLVEDAAHAIPAKYKGRMIGSGSNQGHCDLELMDRAHPRNCGRQRI